MSQIKLLLDVVSDMRHLADSLAEYANAVTTNEHIACEKPAEPINPDDFVPIYDPETDQPEIKEAEPPRCPSSAEPDIRRKQGNSSRSTAVRNSPT